MTTPKYIVSVSGDNSKTFVGDSITVNNYAEGDGVAIQSRASKNSEQTQSLFCNTDQCPGPAITTPVSNCDEPVHKYWPRKSLDDEIKNAQKGRVKILRGTIGTGKTSAALHHIVLNRQKFAISWIIHASSGENRIIHSLTCLAEKLGVSYEKLFETIEQKAKDENIIFLLDNVEKKPDSSKWFKQLWSIRSCVYIIMTTNNPSLGLPDAEQLQVGAFAEAVEFLKGIDPENSDEDLKEICNHFGWNILGLTAAKDYMSSKKMNVRKYLEMLRDREAAKKVRQAELNDHDRTLYESVRVCLEEVDSDKFDAIAATSLVSNNMIPGFLLSNLLSSRNHSSNDHLSNEADLNDLHDQLKSLVYITKENGIRFFSFNSFTQHVIRDMTNESKKEELLYKLAGIFVRHISKDNRFSKGDFLQRTAREHAEIFLREWEDKKKDDRTLIALARLSELVGFTYTQQQPLLEHQVDVNFERARKMLHELCGITNDDLQPSVGFFRKLWGLFQASSEDKNEEIYDIANHHSVVARQLFTKLSEKSSKLSSSTIEELVFLRTVSKQDLSPFPKVVQENQAMKEKFDSAEPLSTNDVSVLVHHKVAYSVDQYRKLFLPELYLSVIYSFGRNYFYMNRATIENPSFYMDLLKIAYCLSREISQQMNSSDAVFHEFLVQTNGLLYLLVNDDTFDQQNAHVKKEAQIHARDLENAIDRYQQLICDERRFFEMGILKRTKDDTYSKLICYQQILKCYKHLLSLENIGNHEEYIRKGVQRCHDIYKLLNIYAPEDITRKKEDLVRYSRHMNAIAEFYLGIRREKYYPEVKKIFAISAEHAEKYDLALYHLEALLGLADVFSRNGKNSFTATQISIRHLMRCTNNVRLLEILHKKPHIQERICKIQKQNVVWVLKYCARLRQRRQGDRSCSYVEESDDVDSTSLDSNTNGAADVDEVSNETFGDAVDIIDEVSVDPVSNEEENEESPQPNISDTMRSGTYQHPTSLLHTLSDHKADKQPQVLKKGEDEESLCATIPDFAVDEKELEMNIHLQKLAREVVAEWKTLAIYLRIDDATIDRITLNNSQDVRQQAYKMLKHWWEKYGKLHADSWREELGKALRDIDRNDLAKDFTGDVAHKTDFTWP